MRHVTQAKHACLRSDPRARSCMMPTPLRYPPDNGKARQDVLHGPPHSSAEYNSLSSNSKCCTDFAGRRKLGYRHEPVGESPKLPGEAPASFLHHCAAAYAEGRPDISRTTRQSSDRSHLVWESWSVLPANQEGEDLAYVLTSIKNRRKTERSRPEG